MVKGCVWIASGGTKTARNSLAGRPCDRVRPARNSVNGRRRGGSHSRSPKVPPVECRHWPNAILESPAVGISRAGLKRSASAPCCSDRRTRHCGRVRFQIPHRLQGCRSAPSFFVLHFITIPVRSRLCVIGIAEAVVFMAFQSGVSVF